MSLDIRQILETLPHRYPFLLVDRIVEMEPGQRVVGIKNVTINEPFFAGHFPGNPVMPGVLILEAMAQATGLLAFKTVERGARRESLYFLVGIDKARFRRPVGPGDQLILKASLVRSRRGIWVFACESSVDGKVVATGPRDFGPDIYTDFVIDFIRRHRDGPFLVYYPMKLTHGIAVTRLVKTAALHLL